MGVVPHKCTHTHTDWYHCCPRSISQYCCSREFSCCCSRCCNHGLCLKNSMQGVVFFSFFLHPGRRASGNVVLTCSFYRVQEKMKKSQRIASNSSGKDHDCNTYCNSS